MVSPQTGETPLPFDATDTNAYGQVITIDTRTYEGRCLIIEGMTRASFAQPLRQALATVQSRLRCYRRAQSEVRRGITEIQVFTGTVAVWRAEVRKAVAKVREIEAERDAAVAAKVGRVAR
jgi:hypothetical protein